jgi:hypothetical protein
MTSNQFGVPRVAATLPGPVRVRLIRTPLIREGGINGFVSTGNRMLFDREFRASRL